MTSALSADGTPCGRHDQTNPAPSPMSAASAGLIAAR